MGFLDSLKAVFSGGGAAPDPGYTLTVRCRRCNEEITARLNLHNDLSLRDEGGYQARKTLVGSGLCFQRIEVTLIFDDNRRLVSHEVSGGEFIEPVEEEN